MAIFILNGGTAYIQNMREPGEDLNKPDTSETIYISGLALLKMLRHGRAGVPMEVMGLMLGEFVDDYTITCVDVFAMPQSGTGVSVESVDEVFQTRMIEMLHQVGRPEMVVGWYHSHPGFGCWLSSVDVATQLSFETLNKRAVAVVVDPIQSVRGKVVIDAFRTINPLHVTRSKFSTRMEARQVTCNLGHIEKPTNTAIYHGLNRQYYSLRTIFSIGSTEKKMLENMSEYSWLDSMNLGTFKNLNQRNRSSLEQVAELTKMYKQLLEEKAEVSKEEAAVKNVGKKDPRRHLQQLAETLIRDNKIHHMGSMINKGTFKS